MATCLKELECVQKFARPRAVMLGPRVPVVAVTVLICPSLRRLCPLRIGIAGDSVAKVERIAFVEGSKPSAGWAAVAQLLERGGPVIGLRRGVSDGNP